jgi:hypothetical protein
MEYGPIVCGTAFVLSLIGAWGLDDRKASLRRQRLGWCCIALVVLLGGVYFVVVDRRWPAGLVFMAAAGLPVLLRWL